MVTKSQQIAELAGRNRELSTLNGELMMMNRQLHDRLMAIYQPAAHAQVVNADLAMRQTAAPPPAPPQRQPQPGDILTQPQ